MVKHEFIELLLINEEFVFSYNGIDYEVIWESGTKRSIYLSTNELLESFSSNEELLENAVIQGKKLKDIINDIKCWFI